MKTKGEIIIEKMKKYCPELYAEGKVYDKVVVVTDGGLTINGWQAIEDAMDEWHRQELPTDDEVYEKFNYGGTFTRVYDNYVGAMWAKYFVRKEKEEPTCPNCKETKVECACMRNKCIRCGNPVGNITFSVCDECWDKDKPIATDTICGDFIWNADKTVSFEPNPNGKFTINKQ